MQSLEEIPLLDLRAQLASYREAAYAAIEAVVEGQQFIMGPHLRDFERDLGAYLSRSGADPVQVVGLSSGTDALLVALMALDIGPGDEVLTTPFSFFATAGVVARLGATPRFVDIEPDSFNVTGAALRAACTAQTRAVIPVHLFGQMADLEGWGSREEGPPIIEDAAQALGAEWAERPVGHWGRAACLSFFPSKNLGGFGDGGALVTQDEAFAQRVRMLRVHGAEPKYVHHIVGGNFRLDALQAAVLGAKLPHLARWTQGRQANAARYGQLFEASGLVARGLIRPPAVGAKAQHVFNQYVVRAQDREGLRAHLRRAGIGTMVYYPTPLHLQPCFAYLGHKPGDFPESERACAEVLALPIYPELPEGALERVVEVIAAYYGG